MNSVLQWLESVKNWMQRSRDYPLAIKSLEQCKLRALEITQEQGKLIEEIKALKGDVSVNNATYWNGKWSKNPVRYKAPTKKKVQEYLVINDSLADIAIKIVSSNKLSTNECDGVVLACQKWLHSLFIKKVFRYVPDDGEVWSAPKTTLDLGRGDCDDFGLLLYSLIRECFIHLEVWDSVKHRLKCVCGNVNRTGRIPSPVGGHFYLLWLGSDGEWYTVESTYYRSSAIADFMRLPHKYKAMYGAIWFTFNEEHAWAQHSIVVSKKDFEKTE